jgi:DNA-binding winged helix-turn-helix (wHTH) protein
MITLSRKEFAPFRLDTVNQCLWRHRDDGDDERISLTPRAFGVLRYLVEHAGRLVTQNELLEALWRLEHREMLQQEILGATRQRMLREISEALEWIASERPFLLVCR